MEAMNRIHILNDIAWVASLALRILADSFCHLIVTLTERLWVALSGEMEDGRFLMERGSCLTCT
jgi:hypothetical protein